jgi:diaminopimelate epimerase
MSGAGNDFIVLPLAPGALASDAAEFVRRICRRGLGVGADGVLFVTAAPGSAANGGSPEPRPSAPGSTSGVAPPGSPRSVPAAPGATPGAAIDTISLAHYNADGGRSDFCGNGSRCAAGFAVRMGMARSPLVVRTGAGALRAEVEGETVTIEAPTPSEPRSLRCEVRGEIHEGWRLTAGVPHFVIEVAAPERVDVARLGAALRSHPALGPEGANIDFLGPLREGRRAIRTYERGVEGETLACGSGALAAGACLARQGAPPPIVLTPTSGISLTIDFAGPAESPRAFSLSGEARLVYEGVLAAPGDAALRRTEGAARP